MPANESVWLLEDQPVRTIGIRMGYSLLCWIIGVSPMPAPSSRFMMFGGPLGGENGVYHFYMLMGAPIFFAVGIVAAAAIIRDRDLEALHRRDSGRCRNEGRCPSVRDEIDSPRSCS